MKNNTKVALAGFGAIGSEVARRLHKGAVPGIELVAVSELTSQYGRPVDKPIRLQDLTRWILALPSPAITHMSFAN